MSRTQIQIGSVRNRVTWTEDKVILMWYRSRSDSYPDAEEESSGPTAAEELKRLHRSQHRSHSIYCQKYTSHSLHQHESDRQNICIYPPRRQQHQAWILLAIRTSGKNRLYWVMSVQCSHCTSTQRPLSTITPSIFNTASSEDLWEEQVLLNLVGTTQALHHHSTTTPSIFDTASSDDLGEEQALLNFVATKKALHQHSTTTPSIFNSASSEDLGEEQTLLNLVGTTQALHQHSTTTPSIFDTASSEDPGEEQA